MDIPKRPKYMWMSSITICLIGLFGILLSNSSWATPEDKIASPKTCQIHYQDINEMDLWRRLVSGGDYRSTFDAMQSLKNLQLLKQKGYELKPLKFLNYTDLMTYSFMDNESGHAIRISESGSVTIFKLYKFDDGQKVRELLFPLNYNSLNEIPPCGGVQKQIEKDLQIRAYYIKSYEQFYTGLLGHSFIYLEAIEKFKKGQQVHLERALRNYQNLMFQAKEYIEKEKRYSPETPSLMALRKFLLSGPISTYRRSQTSLMDALEHSTGANCVGSTAMIMALIKDLQLEPPKDFELGIEIFTDHIQVVLINEKELINWDYLANSADGTYETPIQKMASFPWRGLIRHKPSLFPWEEKQYSTLEFSDKDYLYLPEPGGDGADKNISSIDIDQLEQLISSNDAKRVEKIERIDIFSFEVPSVPLAKYSSTPIPETASNLDLADKPFEFNNEVSQRPLQDIGLIEADPLITLNDSTGPQTPSLFPSLGESVDSDKKLNALEIADDLYDPQAQRIYKESLSLGHYTQEAIEKYGFQHYAPYMPAGHPFHQWANKYAIHPFKLFKRENTKSLLSPIKFLGSSYQWSLDPTFFETYKNLPYEQRLHKYFQLIESKVKIFHKTFAPELIKVLHQNDVKYKELLPLLAELDEWSHFFNSLQKSFFVEIESKSKDGHLSLGDYLNHWSPGVVQSIHQMSQGLLDYKQIKLKDLDQFIIELNDLSENEIQRLVHIDRFTKLDLLGLNPNKVSFSSPYPLFTYVIKHLLRNKNYFYTTPQSQIQNNQSLAFINPEDTSQQVITFMQNDTLPKVSLPKVSDLQSCGYETTTNTICSLPTEDSNGQFAIERTVVELNPLLIAKLMSLSNKNLSPDDYLFFSLTWRLSEQDTVNLRNNNIELNLFNIFSQLYWHMEMSAGVQYSPTDLSQLRINCENLQHLSNYEECIYQTSKNIFQKYSSQNIPLWVRANSYLMPIYEHFKMKYLTQNWMDINHVKPSIYSHVIPPNVIGLPVSQIMSQFSLEDFTDPELMEADFKAMGRYNLFQRTNQIAQSQRHDFDTFRTFRIVEDFIGTSSSEYIFLKKNVLYLSESISLNKGLTTKDKQFRIQLPTHMDPLIEHERFQSLQSEYPDYFQFEEGLL